MITDTLAGRERGHPPEDVHMQLLSNVNTNGGDFTHA